MPKPKVKTKKSKVESVKAWGIITNNRIFRIEGTKRAAMAYANNFFAVIPVLISPLSKSSKAK